MNVSSVSQKTVVGLFDDMSAAKKAIDNLQSAGIARNNISLIAGNESGKYSDYASGTGEVGKGVAGGAGAGAAVGGGLGLLVGLTALAVPGFGPVIAAGPIAGALTGAGVGAAGGGVIGGLAAAGVSEPDADYYAEGVRRGGVLVSVRTSDDLADKASDVLDDAGAKDVDEKSREWQSSGWKPKNPLPARGDVSARSGRSTESDREQSIPVVEEKLDVGKRSVNRGGVRVYSHVTNEPVEETVTLRDEKVKVSRRDADRPANEKDLEAFREGTIELRETSEEPVVRKTARVVEEVVIGKEVSERTETVRDTVRRTDVKVEKMDAAKTDDDADYRSDFDRRYANKGKKYEQYAPAYQFGNTWAGNEKYRGREWSDVEPDMRRDWEKQDQGTWEDFKDSVRHGWDKLRGRG